MSDDRKEAEKKMAKAIFISGDAWLAVYDLLPPSQLGLGIATISLRYDHYVDEHLKTRKWTLKFIRIRSKIGENGTEMEIVNSDGKALPIPQIEVPRKVIGFECISISYIDHNVIAFVNRFCPIFDVCQINLAIRSAGARALENIMNNIWPMIKRNICGIHLCEDIFHRLRQFVPSIHNGCPSLRFVSFRSEDLIIKFPIDDSAMASDGQSLANWLFTPRLDNGPKVLKCSIDRERFWKLKIAQFKTAFRMAPSRANFIVVISFPFFSGDSIVPFVLTNEEEQLTLQLINNQADRCLIVRCPIVRDTNNWGKLEEEAIGWQFCDQWNRIDIAINDNNIGDGPLDDTPGPSDRRK